jgi:type IV pilus assembly protein PilV
MTVTTTPAPRSSEAGFTLVEALVAILVLVFGLAAVANLMLVGASSNAVGNATTASATLASREMERLKAVEFLTLAPGGNLDADQAGYFSVEDVPGVGRVRTRWTIAQLDPRNVFITVRSQAEGAMTGARSRSQFTVFRSCTSQTIGCP